MLIFFNLLFPIIAILIMLFLFKKNMAWWEYLIIFAIPLIAIFTTKYISIYSQINTKEVWNAYLVKAEYEEPWTTWDHETCTREVCTGSGDDRTCHTVTYDCSHCDEHYASYTAYDNLGRRHQISEGRFNYLCKIWNNKTFVELNRHIVKHFGCGKDGDMYVTQTDGVFEHIQPYSDVHIYENRIKSSKSVFNFQKIEKEDVKYYGLYEYSFDFDNYNYNPVKGYTNPLVSERLQQWNSLLGNSKRVHMMMLVYKNKPYETAMKQLSYWKSGNKNEFILCLNLNDSNKITWTKVISWTDVEKLKLEVERTVANMEFKPLEIVDTMAVHVRKDFIKKDFREFKYIAVEPTEKATLICFIVVLVLTIGLCIFSVMNDFTLENPTGD